MDIKKASLIFGITLIVFIAMILLFLDYSLPKKILVKEFDLEVVSGGKSSFNLDKDKIHFAKVCRGCNGRHGFNINVENGTRYEAKFLIVTYNNDNVNDWITIIPPGGIVDSESKLFSTYISVPENATEKKYEGAFIANLFKPLPWR
jgi:hypothetical protein